MCVNRLWYLLFIYSPFTNNNFLAMALNFESKKKVWLLIRNSLRVNMLLCRVVFACRTVLKFNIFCNMNCSKFDLNTTPGHYLKPKSKYSSLSESAVKGYSLKGLKMWMFWLNINTFLLNNSSKCRQITWSGEQLFTELLKSLNRLLVNNLICWFASRNSIVCEQLAQSCGLKFSQDNEIKENLLW
jgi:hypothetical protein